MYYDGIDLTDPHAFHLWVFQELQLNTVEVVVSSLLSLGTDIGVLRALCTAYYGESRQVFNQIKDKGLYSESKLVELLARAIETAYQTDVYVLQTPNDQFSGNVNQVYIAANFVEEVQCLPKSKLQREVEAFILLLHAKLLDKTEEVDKALAQTAKAYEFAKSIDASYLVEKAMFNLIAYRYRQGEIDSTISQLNNFADEYAVRTPFKRFLDRNMLCFNLLLLGNAHHAYDLIKNFDAGGEADNIRDLGHYVQKIASFCGWEAVDSEVHYYSRYAQQGWFNYSFQKFARVRNQSRTNRTQKSIDKLLTDVIEKINNVKHSEFPWNSVMAVWAKALAYHWRGQSLLAFNTAQTLPMELHKQWLVTRALFAALKLELSMKLDAFELSTFPYELELRQVFLDAEAMKNASIVGLADLVSYWCPIAAAYMMVSPNTIKAFEGTEICIFDCHQSSAYNIRFPPSLSGELILRSMDIDRYTHFPQEDHGSRRKARNELKTKRGNNTYYRPVIAPPTIIYGLVKADKGSHFERAEQIALRYGIVPSVPSYRAEQHELISRLEKATRQLLNKNLTPKGFSHALVEPH